MINETGYIRPTFEKIVSNKSNEAKRLYGDDMDTTDKSVLGKHIRINAKDQAEAYEDIEAAYYARFPNTATGTSLDRLCPFVQITRNPATPATHKIKIIGTPNAVIPMGFLVGTEDNEVQFYSLQDCELSTIENEVGSGIVEVECVTAGTIGNVSIGLINSCVEAIADIDSIVHLSIEEYGQDEESDVDLRKRFNIAALGNGESNFDAIKGAVIRVPDVISVSLIENDTDETDIETSIPPHSFKCYVYGGKYREQEIAEAIFSKKPVGIPSCGDVTCSVKDSGGHPHPIKFSYATPINLKMKINVKANSNFEETGKNNIQTNISEYINNLGMGADVILNSLFGPIYNVTGVIEVTSIVISINDGEYLSQSVTSNIWEVPEIIADDIEVEAVIV